MTCGRLGIDTSSTHSTEGRQVLHGGSDSISHGGFDIFKKILLGHSETQPPDILSEGRCIIRHRRTACRRIFGIRTSYGLQQHGGIGNRADHWPNMIARMAQGIDAKPTDAAVGGLEANNTAERSRNPNRAARISPQRSHRQPPQPWRQHSRRLSHPAGESGPTDFLGFHSEDSGTSRPKRTRAC